MSNSVILIILGGLFSVIGPVLLSYGFMYLGEERNQERAELESNYFYLSESSFNVRLKFPENSLQNENLNKVLKQQKQASVIINVSLQGSKEKIGRLILNGKWEDETGIIHSLQGNTTLFVRSTQEIVMLDVKPLIEYINNDFKIMKPNQSYEFYITAHPSFAITLTPESFSIRTKTGVQHYIEKFNNQENGWFIGELNL